MSPIRGTASITQGDITTRYGDFKRDLDSCVGDLVDNIQAQVALSWLCTRTLAYGKTIERVPAHHVLEGITSGRGEYVSGPVGMAIKTWRTALSYLEGRGFIVRHYDRNSNLSVEVVLEKIMKQISKLKTPKTKKAKGGSNKHEGGVKKARHKSHIFEVPEVTSKDVTLDQEVEVEQEIAVDCKPSLPTELESNLAHAREANVKAVAKKAKAGLTSKKGITATWNTLTKEHFNGECAGRLDQTSWRSFSSFYKNSDVDSEALMIWTIQNWQRVCDEFTWTLTAKYNTVTIGAVPDLAFFCRHAKRIHELHIRLHGEGGIIIRAPGVAAPTTDEVIDRTQILETEKAALTRENENLKHRAGISTKLDVKKLKEEKKRRRTDSEVMAKHHKPSYSSDEDEDIYDTGVSDEDIQELWNT